MGLVLPYSGMAGKMFARTLSNTAQNALALLGKSGVLKTAYLAGCSALALHLGHRPRRLRLLLEETPC